MAAPLSNKGSPEMDLSWVEANTIVGSEIREQYDALSYSTDSEHSITATDLEYSDMEADAQRPLTPANSEGYIHTIDRGYAKRKLQREENSHSKAVLSSSTDRKLSPCSPGHESEFLMPVLDASTGLSTSTHLTDSETQRVKLRKVSTPRRASSRIGIQRDDAVSVPKQDIADSNASRDALEIVGGAIQRTLKMSQPFTAYILSGILLILVINTVVNIAHHQASDAATRTLCSLPLSSWTMAGRCEKYSAGATHGSSRAREGILTSAEIDQLVDSDARFEEILSAKSEVVALPAVMKRGEATIRDLRVLVSVSELRAKRELVEEFDEFIVASRAAVQDFTRFNARVDAAADMILSTARWTRRMLEEDMEAERRAAAARERNPVATLAGRLLSAVLFPGTSRSGAQTPAERIRLRYLEHGEAVEGQIHALLLEAEGLALALHRMEGRLDAVGMVAARGCGLAEAEAEAHRREDILGRLWTRLTGGGGGGGGAAAARLDADLAVLRQVDAQRAAAADHVGRVLVHLRGMEADLASLRERVAAAALAPRYPLAVHLDNIERGVRRLDGARARARRRDDDFRISARSAGGGVDVDTQGGEGGGEGKRSSPPERGR